MAFHRQDHIRATDVDAAADAESDLIRAFASIGSHIRDQIAILLTSRNRDHSIGCDDCSIFLEGHLFACEVDRGADKRRTNQ